MPLFEYTARNVTNGQIQKGQVDLKSKEEVSAVNSNSGIGLLPEFRAHAVRPY
ncbi:MAG TPA: hypothetical protein VHH32_00665 [Gemmatimonadales bacterium]|nr:hypothetical protein [Gemmatimonadales bacterium]